MPRLPVLPTALAALFVVTLGGLELKEWRAHRPPEMDPSGFPKSELQAARAWSTVHRCWVGAPLALDETLEARLRSNALAVRPSSASEAWPARCAPPLVRLLGELRLLGDGAPAITPQLTELEHGLARGGPMPPSGFYLDDWRTRASRLEPLDALAPAPSCAPALSIGHPLVSTSAVVHNLTQGWDGRVRFENDSGYRRCVVEPDGKRVACRHVPDPVAAKYGTFTAGGSGPGPALLVTPPDGFEQQESVVMKGDEIVWRGPDYVDDAVVDPSGTLRLVVASASKRELLGRSADGKTTRKPLEASANRFFDGLLVELGARLRVQPLDGAAPVDLGPIVEERPSVRLVSACHTSEADFALFSDGYLLRHAGARWLVTQISTPTPTMRCDAGTVSFMRAEPRAVERTVCGAAGCTPERIDLPVLPEGAGGRAAATCPGGAVILLEASGGLVSAAVAPLHELAAAERVPLFITKDLTFGTVHETAPLAVSIEGGAFVLVGSTLKGLVAARVGCDGAVSAIGAELD